MCACVCLILKVSQGLNSNLKKEIRSLNLDLFLIFREAFVDLAPLKWLQYFLILLEKNFLISPLFCITSNILTNIDATLNGQRKSKYRKESRKCDEKNRST